jgi:hypothetical protein
MCGKVPGSIAGALTASRIRGRSSSPTALVEQPVGFIRLRKLPAMREEKHLVLCRIQRRPPRLDMTVCPYLSRYTHRVAISNHRLIASDHRGVTFRYKNYRVDGPA